MGLKQYIYNGIAQATPIAMISATEKEISTWLNLRKTHECRSKVTTRVLIKAFANGHSKS